MNKRLPGQCLQWSPRKIFVPPDPGDSDGGGDSFGLRDADFVDT